MERFEKHLINWLIIGFFLIIDIALIPLLYKYVFPRVSVNTDAFLTSVGAIIGGSLTLIGVKWTLDKQKKEKFIEEYPILLEK